MQGLGGHNKGDRFLPLFHQWKLQYGRIDTKRLKIEEEVISQFET